MMYDVFCDMKIGLVYIFKSLYQRPNDPPAVIQLCNPSGEPSGGSAYSTASAYLSAACLQERDHKEMPVFVIVSKLNVQTLHNGYNEIMEI